MRLTALMIALAVYVPTVAHAGFQQPPISVPEPGTAFVLAVGAGLWMLVKGRRRRK